MLDWQSVATETRPGWNIFWHHHHYNQLWYPFWRGFSEWGAENLLFIMTSSSHIVLSDGEWAVASISLARMMILPDARSETDVTAIIEATSWLAINMNCSSILKRSNIAESKSIRNNVKDSIIQPFYLRSVTNDKRTPVQFRWTNIVRKTIAHICNEMLQLWTLLRLALSIVGVEILIKLKFMTGCKAVKYCQLMMGRSALSTLSQISESVPFDGWYITKLNLLQFI